MLTNAPEKAMTFLFWTIDDVPAPINSATEACHKLRLELPQMTPS